MRKLFLAALFFAYGSLALNSKNHCYDASNYDNKKYQATNSAISYDKGTYEISCGDVEVMVSGNEECQGITINISNNTGTIGNINICTTGENCKPGKK